MKLRKYLFQLLSAEFWVGFCAALVPLGIVFFVTLIAYFNKESTLSNVSIPMSHIPTQKEIILAIVHENRSVFKYYKCNGYIISFRCKYDLPDTVPYRVNLKKTSLPLIPDEYLEYITKIANNNDGKLTFSNLSNILLPCQGKNGEIIYNTIMDYYDLDIDIYGATMDSMDDLLPNKNSK